MAISSSSTLAEVAAQYDDNADYDNPPDAAKAKLFTQAVRILLRRVPTLAGKGGNQVSFNLGILREQLTTATQFLAVHDTSTAANRSRALHADFRNFRE